MIAFNGGRGVDVAAGTGNPILGNSFHSNGSLGIELRPFDVTPNDPDDADTGPNNLQNFPLINSFTIASGSATIAGTLDSTASTTFRLEFFSNQSSDPSGFGEGETFLGFADVTTDASGDASFSVSFPVAERPHTVTATATDPAGNTSEFSPALRGRLLNISTRMRVLTGDNVLIGGFIVAGTQEKIVVVRRIGPSLPLADSLPDPILELHDSTGATIATNNDWKESQQTEIEATGLMPTNDAESAIVATLPANSSAYTAILRGVNDTTGVGLVEVYDLDQITDSQLANISTRGFVDTGDNVMIGGIIIGNATTEVLLRALGPSLSGAGVGGVLDDPTLELRDVNGALLAANDNWRSDEEAEIEATSLQPTDDLESAVLQTLDPGAYTAIVRGAGDTTGVGLVEAYNLN